ncbi:MAG: hypothetical protein KAY32_15390 [Candidatus Eisenbacteria sp.]|nr:hypothetical protein [Candidatus Eisenbacteria bacterium]
MPKYPYYKFQDGGGRQFYEGRYWNCNGKGICIIAVVTNNVDWAAYIGADNGWSEEACLEWTAQNGAKLSELDARYYFPEFRLIPYRG